MCTPEAGVVSMSSFLLSFSLDTIYGHNGLGWPHEPAVLHVTFAKGQSITHRRVAAAIFSVPLFGQQKSLNLIEAHLRIS